MKMRGTRVPFFIAWIMDAEIIRKAVEQIIEGTDMYLVHLSVSPRQRISVLLDTDAGISIDECGYVNRHLVEALGPAMDDYDVEVSSPGLTEPFRITRQFVKHVGDDLQVVCTDGTRHKGLLVSADDTEIVLRTTRMVRQPGERKKSAETVNETLTRADIKSAKLIIKFK